jgi:hypothetical protein
VEAAGFSPAKMDAHSQRLLAEAIQS